MVLEWTICCAKILTHERASHAKFAELAQEERLAACRVLLELADPVIGGFRLEARVGLGDEVTMGQLTTVALFDEKIFH